MKASKALFFSTITVFGVMFAVFAVMAQSTTPSFEVSPTEGPSVDGTIELSATQLDQNEQFSVQASVDDISGVDSVVAKVVNQNGITVAQANMNDSGASGDTTAGDGIYTVSWNMGSKPNGVYYIDLAMRDDLGNSSIVRAASTLTIVGAYDNSCSSSADCEGANESCCEGECAFNSCSTSDDCIRCVNGLVDPNTGNCIAGTEVGVCETNICPNSCDYDGSSGLCVTDADCGSLPTDACCNGDCQTHLCLIDNDCSGMQEVCDTSVCPHVCVDNPDTTPPTVVITEPLDYTSDPNQPFTNDDIYIKATVTDTESNIDHVDFEVDGAQTYRQEYPEDPAYPNDFAMTISFSDGMHTVIVTGVDTAGNTNEAQVIIEFDLGSTTAPIVDELTTDKSSYTSSESVAVNLVAHDDDSDITSAEIFTSAGGGALKECPSGTCTLLPAQTLDWDESIGASSIVDLANAYMHFAEQPKKFRIPFIKAADAEIVGNQNCTTTTTNNTRYLYAMVADDTNPPTPYNGSNIVISTTGTSCVPINSIVNPQVQITPSTLN